MKAPLTDLQLRDLTTFREFVRDMGRSPSYKELALIWDCAAGTAWNRISELIQKGYLIRHHKRAGYVFEPPFEDMTVHITLDNQNRFVHATGPDFIKINVTKETS